MGTLKPHLKNKKRKTPRDSARKELCGQARAVLEGLPGCAAEQILAEWAMFGVALVIAAATLIAKRNCLPKHFIASAFLSSSSTGEGVPTEEITVERNQTA